MPGMIGKKIGMTSLFDDNGKNLPCTVIEVTPNVLTQIKTTEKDGYDAVQMGYGEKTEKSTTSALQGHFKKSKTTPKQKLQEFDSTGLEEELKPGEELTIDAFVQEGQFVDITGRTKGKGFQGAVKRHGFSGAGEQTHGQDSMKRAPGAVGGGADPSRIFKGMRMAGRAGNNQVLIQNLRVLKVDADKNLMVVKGSVPGAKNTLVTITK